MFLNIHEIHCRHIDLARIRIHLMVYNYRYNRGKRLTSGFYFRLSFRTIKRLFYEFHVAGHPSWSPIGRQLKIIQTDYDDYNARWGILIIVNSAGAQSRCTLGCLPPNNPEHDSGTLFLIICRKPSRGSHNESSRDCNDHVDSMWSHVRQVYRAC